LSPIYELVGINREAGISISTLGVGGDFDEELLRTLAEYGCGASRSPQNREAMMQIFDSDREFERFAVPAAGTIQMEVEFSPEVEVLDAWGFHYAIEGKRVSYELPDLHMGDYRTLLIRYRIPPGNQRRQTATIKTTELYGSAYANKVERTVVLTDPPDVEHPALPVERAVILSQAMADFAEAMQEIGDRYYAGESPGRFGAALERARAAEQDLGAARQNLGDIRAFETELAVLARYIELLTEAHANSPPESEAAPRRSRMSTSGSRYSRMAED
jgi:Ca-activated chloride channel family protein